MEFDQWEEFRLGELCNIQSSKRIYAKDYVENGVAFYRSKEIILKHKKEIINETLYIKHEKFHEIKEKYGAPKENDLLLTSVGTLGVPYLVKKNEEFYFKDGNLTWFNNFSETVDSKYIYYWLLSPSGKREIESITIGSTQQALTMVSLRKMIVRLPSYKKQRQISQILGTIDDKIQINLNSISNLEQLAQTLFKRWFVDFEFPNKNGDPYKSSGGEMVESELGMIPAGWEVYKLTELVNNISESINKKEKESAIFLNTSDILSGSILKREFSSTKEMPGQAKKLIKENDILYSEIRPKNKRFAYINFSAEDYVVSTKLMVLRTNEEIFSSKVLYLFLTNNETVNELQLVAEQRSGTFPQITFKQLDHFKFALPSKSIFMNYYQQLEKMIDMQLDLNIQNESLIELRDTLLPKLLSGEIELPEETEVIEDVPIS